MTDEHLALLSSGFAAIAALAAIVFAGAIYLRMRTLQKQVRRLDGRTRQIDSAVDSLFSQRLVEANRHVRTLAEDGARAAE